MKTLIVIEETQLEKIMNKIDSLTDIVLNLETKKDNKVMGTKEAADYLGVSANWIRTKIKSEELKAVRLGIRNYKIEKKDLENLKRKIEIEKEDAQTLNRSAN